MRPRTSKPRGVCQYYNTPRGCFAGDKCKFLHGEPDDQLLTPFDKAKRCRFYAQGFCKRGDACWFIHASETKEEEDDDDDLCSICFEKPTTYGLLGGCSHVFCTTCIKQWRDPTNKPGGVLDSGNTKKCPMCRAVSRFITPSSRFWKDGTEEKNKVVQAYKESMARVPCRYFQKSLQKNKDKPLCQYGKDCFYQHLNPDGTPHIFKDGVDPSMHKYRLSFPTRPGLSFFGDDINFTSIFSPILPFPTRNTPRRDRDRHVMDEYFRLTPALQPTPTTQPQTQLQTEREALLEVSRSLNMVYGAMSESGMSVDTLNDAVEALRAGLAGAGLVPGPRPDDQGASSGAHDATDQERTAAEDEEAARQEDDVMERLEDLADQMLASITALQRASRQSPDNVDDDSDDDMPGLGRISDSDEDSGSEESMPQLESVSNTSESDADVGDDDDDDDDVRWDLDSEGIAQTDSDAVRDGLFDMWPPWGWQSGDGSSGAEGNANGNRNRTNTNNRRRHRRSAQSQIGTNGNTYRNRTSTATSQAPRPAHVASTPGDASSLENGGENATFGTDAGPTSIPPTTVATSSTTTTSNPTCPVEAICNALPSLPCPVRSTSPPSDAVAVVVNDASSSASITASVPEPPFVTDGRGRVVGTSSSSSSDSEESATIAWGQRRGTTQSRKESGGAEASLRMRSASEDSSADLTSSDGCRSRSESRSKSMNTTGRETVVPVGAVASDDEEDDHEVGHPGGSGGASSTLFDWFNSLF